MKNNEMTSEFIKSLVKWGAGLGAVLGVFYPFMYTLLAPLFLYGPQRVDTRVYFDMKWLSGNLLPVLVWEVPFGLTFGLVGGALLGLANGAILVAMHQRLLTTHRMLYRIALGVLVFAVTVGGSTIGFYPPLKLVFQSSNVMDVALPAAIIAGIAGVYATQRVVNSYLTA